MVSTQVPSGRKTTKDGERLEGSMIVLTKDM